MTTAHFNPHGNVTADGVLITEGLRVWTNDMTRGVVRGDDSSGEHRCCSDAKTFDDATHHPKGQMRVMGGWFTDHCDWNIVRGEDDCAAGCRHDHWFRVETDDGTRSYDGERLATTFNGKQA